MTHEFKDDLSVFVQIEFSSKNHPAVNEFIIILYGESVRAAPHPIDMAEA